MNKTFFLYSMFVASFICFDFQIIYPMVIHLEDNQHDWHFPARINGGDNRDLFALANDTYRSLKNWLEKYYSSSKVEILLEQVNRGSEIPLYSVLFSNSFEMVETLFETTIHKCDYKKTATKLLPWAALGSTCEIIQFLVAHGASVNTEDRNNARPLHWAALSGRSDLAACLLNLGAEKDAKDKTGDTALHYAAQLGKKDVVVLLLEHKVDAALINNAGKTAGDLAKEEGHGDLERILRGAEEKNELRLFVALEIPNQLKQEIARIQKNLKPLNLFEGTYERLENLHITLAFLGPTPSEKRLLIDKKLKSVNFSNFDIKLGALGLNSESNPTVLWLTVDAPQLSYLAGMVGEMFEEYRQQHSFVGHITVARIKKIANEAVLRKFLNDLQIADLIWRADAFALWKSESLGKGSVYSVMNEYTLRRSDWKGS